MNCFPFLFFFLSRNFLFTNMQLFKNRGFIEEKAHKIRENSIHTLLI